MNGKTEQDRCRLIAHQVVTEFARDKVSKALYEAVLESLDFGPRDLPSPADRDWMRGPWRPRSGTPPTPPSKS